MEQAGLEVAPHEIVHPGIVHVSDATQIGHTGKRRVCGLRPVILSLAVGTVLCVLVAAILGGVLGSTTNHNRKTTSPTATGAASPPSPSASPGSRAIRKLPNLAVTGSVGASA